jgi:hypothetical protein
MCIFLILNRADRACADRRASPSVGLVPGESFAPSGPALARA